MSNGSAYRLSHRPTQSQSSDDAGTTLPTRSVGPSLRAGYIDVMTHPTSLNCVQGTEWSNALSHIRSIHRAGAPTR